MTKKEILTDIVKNGTCIRVHCGECPYYEKYESGQCGLRKIGAMAILRQNRKAYFDKSNVLTCLTADKGIIFGKGYFGMSLHDIKHKIEKKSPVEILRGVVLDDSYLNRFLDSDGQLFPLWYPLDYLERG